MEALIGILSVIGLLGALDWAALRWGYNSRRMHVNDNFATERRSDW